MGAILIDCLQNTSMKTTFFFLLILITFKSYGQDIYSDYQKKLQVLEADKSREEKAVFDKWAVEYTLKKGQAWSACDGWPGIGYVCRLHRHQCCYNGCGAKCMAEQKNISAAYASRIAQCDADYERAKESATKKANEDRAKEEQLEHDKEAKEKQENDKIAKDKASKEKSGREKDGANGGKLNEGSRASDSKDPMAGSKARLKAQYDAQQSSKALADNLNQGGEDFMVSTLFSEDNLLQGSKFVDSHFGFNVTINPISVRNVPLYADIVQGSANGQSFGSAKTSALTFYGYCFDGELYLLNNKFVHLKALGAYGMSYSYLGGTYGGSNTVNESSYGAEAGLGMDQIKAFAGYIKGSRDVVYSFDDYSNANFSNTQGGSASYDFERKYAGLVYHYDNDNERYVKVAYIYDTPGYSTENIHGYALSLRGWFDFSVEYFPTYPSAGKPGYTVTGNDEQSFWSVRFGKTFTLFKGRYTH